MRKILLFAAALLTVTAANAKVWRINYDDNAQADFKTIAACLSWNGFTEGDTLYMEPGVHNGSQANNTISKSCTILGPGWGFQSSTNSISELESAVFNNNILFNQKGISVNISGIVAVGGITGSNYTTTAYTLSNLIIERCYLSSLSALNATNMVVKNCYISGRMAIGLVTSGSIVGNIIRGQLDLTTPGVRLVVDHNTIVCNISSSQALVDMNTNTVFSNNIVINTGQADNVAISSFLNPDYSMYNNVLSFTTATIEAAEYLGDHTYDLLKDPACTNKIDATIANTFTCHIAEGIVDNAMYYQVKDGAVAKTADSNGGECGAFGGDFPYQLNGRPNGVPYLYDINVPTHTTNNQLSISFKVAGNNE